MAQCLSKVWNTLDKLSKQVIKRISRIENVQVDALVGIAAILSIKKAVLVSVHLQTTSSIAVAPVYNTSETSVGWIHEIETYLQTGDLPKESKQAHKIRVQAASLHSDRGQPLQAILWRFIPQVLNQRGSTVCIGRTTWRCMWQSHKGPKP